MNQLARCNLTRAILNSAEHPIEGFRASRPRVYLLREDAIEELLLPCRVSQYRLLIGTVEVPDHRVPKRATDDEIEQGRSIPREVDMPRYVTRFSEALL